MPGAPDPEYVLARRALLDALQALGEQRSAVVLVGAQAIYLHTGDADLAVAPYTTDGDVAIDPSRLRNDPKLGGAGFSADTRQVGTWIMSRPLEGRAVEVKIDLMVPEAVGGPGRRGARLGPHGNRAARKARGLEATLVDHQQRTIEALENEDERAFEVAVAGPASLLVAKLHKIAERIDTTGRREDKDALDILRLLQAVTTEVIAASMISATPALQYSSWQASIPSTSRNYSATPASPSPSTPTPTSSRAWTAAWQTPWTTPYERASRALLLPHCCHRGFRLDPESENSA